MRIAPEIWLDDLFARIKDREENPPELSQTQNSQQDPDENQEDGGPPDLGNQDEEVKDGDEENKDGDGEAAKAPPAPVVPVRAKEDRWLTDLEYEVRNTFRKGEKLELHQIDEIIKLQVNAAVAQTKGYVLDLDIVRNSTDQLWAIRLIESEIVGGDNELTHIIELLADDEEVKMRAGTVRVQTETGIPFSRWERNERNKPKIVNPDDED